MVLMEIPLTPYGFHILKVPKRFSTLSQKNQTNFFYRLCIFLSSSSSQAIKCVTLTDRLSPRYIYKGKHDATQTTPFAIF